MTELIIYSQQLARNGKFALLSNYQWITTGSWIKSNGKIFKSSGSGTLSQTNVFTIGVKYEFKYTISGGSGSGTVVVTDGVSTIHNGTSNGTYTVEFTAGGNNISFTANSSFTASISNVSIMSIPTMFRIDIDNETSIPFKFSTEDIFDVGKGKAPRTGSFLIKGTHDANIAFRHIYLISSNSIFNPNIKTKCTLVQDGIEFFSGVLCLDDINEKIDGNQGITDIEYNVSIVESVIDIYSTIGEKTVRDLSFSEYDHLFNIDVAIKSFNDSITFNGSPDNNTLTVSTFNVTSQASVIAGGLNRIELTFSSIHNFTVGQEVYVEPKASECNVNGGGNYLFDQVVYSIPSSNKIVLECSDPCAPYSSASPSNVATVSDKMLAGYGYYYPCADNGTYLKNVYAYPDGTGLLETGQSYIIKYFSVGDDFTNVGAASNATGVVFTASGTTPNTWTSGSLLAKFRDTSLAIGTDPLNSKFGSNFSSVGQNDSVFEIYDFIPYLFVREILIKTFDLADVDYDCDLFDTKLFRSLIIPMSDPYTLIEGATLQMDEWTPNVKLKDILNSVLNMFNLSMTRKGKTLAFINRGEYFDNTAIDWSDKIDTDSKLKLTMLNKDGVKIYQFKYAQSKDYINTLFDQTYGSVNNTSGLININDRNYGDYLTEIESDYKSDTKEVLVLFEPSILAGGSSEFIDGIYGESNAIMPMHFNSDSTLDKIQRTYSPKILIAGKRWSGLNLAGNALPMDINFISVVSPSQSLKKSWYYSSAMHLDNPFQVTPTHDLNFYTPLAVYFAEYVSCIKLFNNTTDLNNTNWPNNSLYLKYWSRYLNQITSIYSKKVSGRFKLSLSDVYNLDFSKPVIVGNLKLKLITISDWYINSDGLCNVEFLITK
jgi:hypothetical protein